MEPGKGWLGSDVNNADELTRERAHTLGVPFVLLSRDDIATDAMLEIPEPLSRAYSLVAYGRDGSHLEVAFANLDDIEKVRVLKPHLKIKPRLTSQASVKQALVLYQKHLKDVYGNALQGGSPEALILHALVNQASNIHLDIAPAGTRVRYRIGGVLHEAMRLTQEAGHALVQNIKSIAKLFPIAASQSGKFKISKDDAVVLVSVANVAGADGEKLTLRISHEQIGQQGFTLSALGLHGKALEDVHAMLNARSGLVLVAGKTESGKTTTLYTLLDHVHGSHIASATIEDTIEHRLPYASQTQTRPELGLGMLAGLRSVLRTDPDVVLVGNIDSAETATVALEAASRGVLVLAAIDAQSAADAVDRLTSWGITLPLIARALSGVIAQKLGNTLPQQKGEPSTLTRDEAAQLEDTANFARVLAALKDEGVVHEHTAWKDVEFYRSNGSGGKIGLQEVLPVTSAIKEMIVEGADADTIESQAREEGMLTLAEDALFKAAQGLVSVDDAIEVARG